MKQNPQELWNYTKVMVKNKRKRIHIYFFLTTEKYLQFVKKKKIRIIFLQLDVLRSRRNEINMSIAKKKFYKKIKYKLLEGYHHIQI